MTMTYVFPDLHGRLDQYRAAMEAIENDGMSSLDTIVFLGDYIDRGLDSAQLVKEVRSLQAKRPLTVCLSGNHEMMMLWALSLGDEQMNGWMINGGLNTIESYKDAMGGLDEAAMKADVEWFTTLPMYHEDKHRVYVHAGVSQYLALEDQSAEDLHWMRYADGDARGYKGKHVVHGHTPDKNGPVTTGNRTAMDVGAVWTGRYVVGVFDDDVPGGPARLIWVDGKD